MRDGPAEILVSAGCQNSRDNFFSGSYSMAYTLTNILLSQSCYHCIVDCPKSCPVPRGPGSECPGQ